MSETMLDNAIILKRRRKEKSSTLDTAVHRLLCDTHWRARAHLFRIHINSWLFLTVQTNIIQVEFCNFKAHMDTIYKGVKGTVTLI